MERTYTYSKKQYAYQVTFVGYFCVLICLYLLYRMIFVGFSTLLVLLFLVAAYGAINTFYLRAYPEQIIVTDKEITFITHGRSATFKIAEINTFLVRAQPNNYQLWVRIIDNGGRRGKYWITTGQFNDPIDLTTEIYCILKIVSPNNMVFRGREKMYNHRPGQQPEEKPYTEKDFMQ